MLGIESSGLRIRSQKFKAGTELQFSAFEIIGRKQKHKMAECSRSYEKSGDAGVMIAILIIRMRCLNEKGIIHVRRQC